MSGQSKKAIPKKYYTLAIIGNGFDLAHGYKTRYDQFVSASDSPRLAAFRAECASDTHIKTWYNFEESICRLTFSNYQAYLNEEHADAGSHIRELNRIFSDIHFLLIAYLKNETENCPVQKRTSVKKFLKRKTFAISFNYTDIADQYPCTVYHIHGSLKENDILLGYDYRDEPCLAGYDDMMWSKYLCREALAFRRYLKETQHLNNDDDEYRNLISALKIYYRYENSGRGIDKECEPEIPYFDTIESILYVLRHRGVIPDVDLSRIKTLVIMGHGIEADQAYLKKVLNECRRLKKIVLFRYKDEPDESYDAKVGFLRTYCKQICSRIY